MPDLDRARDDLGYFADMVGAPLAPWQLASLGLQALVTVIVAPRQSGKSRAMIVLALWWCMRRPGQRVMLVAASEESGKRGLRLAGSVVDGSPLLGGSVVERQAAKVAFSNRSTLAVTALSEAAIRGATNDLLLMDEAALHSEAVVAAAMPTVAARVASGARAVMASSAAAASGPFFDHAVRGEAGGEGVRTFRWRLEDATWISPSWLAAQRESMSAVRFAAEYEGVFASGADSLFTRAALDTVVADFHVNPLDRLRGPARLVAGFDPGAVHDRSALAAVGRVPLVGGGTVLAVVGTRTWPLGHPLSTGSAGAPGVAEDFAALPCAWDEVVGERNGLGEAIVGQHGVLWRMLTRRGAQVGGARQTSGFRVIEEGVPPPGPLDLERAVRREQQRRALLRTAGAFTTRKVGLHVSAEAKAAMYGALVLLVNRRALLIRASDERLVRELLTLKVDLSPSGSERVEAPRDSSGHADLASALALCTGVVRSPGGWSSRLAALADPTRVQLPAPSIDGLVAGPTVLTRDGLTEIPTCPAVVSVRGPETTLPGLTGPAYHDPDAPVPVMRRA